jgi:hypothetical protein
MDGFARPMRQASPPPDRRPAPVPQRRPAPAPAPDPGYRQPYPEPQRSRQVVQPPRGLQSYRSRTAQPQEQVRERAAYANPGNDAQPGYDRRYRQPAGQQDEEQPRRRAEAPGRAKGLKKQRRSGGRRGWRVAAQFLVGLLVIAAVAAAIVGLYVRYYQ